MTRASASGLLVLVIALIAVDLWDLSGEWSRSYRLVAYPTIAAVLLLGARGARPEDENRPPAPWRSSWALGALVTIALGVLLLGVAAWIRVEGERFRPYWITRGADWIPITLGTVLLQQLALHRLFWPLFLESAGEARTARGLLALVFGALHLPSLVVAGLTGGAAFVWSILHSRTGRIAPLVASHLVLAIIARAALPERVSYNMAVGATALPARERYRNLREPALAALDQRTRSDEYFAAQDGDERRFVESLYLDSTGRRPRADELDVWLRHLRGGSRAEVVSYVLGSEEVRRSLAAH